MFAQLSLPEDDDCMVTYNSTQSETFEDVTFSTALTANEKTRLHDLLSEYADVFTDKPGLTAESVFIIDTGDAKPIMQRPYRLPHSTKIEVNKEVQTLLDQGIIRESTSE